MPEPSVDGKVRTLDNNLSAKNVENSSQVSSEPSMTKNSFTSANGAVDYTDDVEVVDVEYKKTSSPVIANGTKTAMKVQDIRNFLFISTKKRPHDTEDFDSPASKKARVLNGDAGTDGNLAVLDPPEISHPSVSSNFEIFENGADLISRQGHNQPSVVHPLCPMKHPVDPVEECSRRKIKIVLTRLEETEHFTDKMKGLLEKWKEWKSWEGKEYEVEAILDYSWCKSTVNPLLMSSFVVGINPDKGFNTMPHD